MHTLDGIMFNLENVHICKIVPGNTILHNGTLKTVCKNNITWDKDMGTKLFGDSYNLGYKPVKRARILRIYNF